MLKTFFINHVVFFKDFKVLACVNRELSLKIKESIFISHDKPALNRKEESLQLCLFGRCHY